MSAADVVFWACAAFVVYTYAGYPLVMAALAAMRKAPEPPALGDADLPAATIVMSAYNEAGRLPAKLDNLRELHYPLDRVQVMVVSDGSTDETETILARRSDVRMVALPLRRGKAHALNVALQQVSTPVVVFCDVRQDLDPDALRWLARDLADPRIGVVSGELSHRPSRTRTGQNVGLYWRYEKWIRKAESRLHSTVGATGALYAMRTVDWRALREGAILDDFDNPMQVVRRGKRAILEPRAVAWDVVQEDAAGERRRKIRTLSGNFQSFADSPWLFSPLSNPVWFQFMSHKVFRLLVPYALLAALAASLLAQGPVYRVACALQAVFYGLAAIGHGWPAARRSRLVSLAHVFCELNLAAVWGLATFLRGRIDPRWEKTA
ncbi:glycosyltransferase family 2 protein [Thiomonas sp. FB-6]|uniref:glycosyltransferase family 2 protein n=1 Tax=Thiomonas sp. FB-6 TaxID=1158291 RepID=UPI0003689C87|nr:glycosyltransferase family 2 protein [Thiomonas sp. FB-6]